MTSGAHLTIGEVLSLLQEEFPDITVSKIRFLESQGLLEPQRTPSGYRKFYPHDIERLRWILRQQRDNFLPLRVIKDKLEDGGDGAEDAGHDEETRGGVGDDDADPEVARADADGADDAPVADATIAPPATDGGWAGASGPLDVGPSSVSLTLEELASASGLDIGVVVELERYGLVHPRAIGEERYYDGEALIVARLAASFRAFGVEARHLRMFKTAADREAGVYEQTILPLVRQRDPGARKRARDNLADMAQLGEGVHRAMLRLALRTHLES